MITTIFTPKDMTACSGLSVVLVVRNCRGRAKNSLTKTGVVGSASTRRSPLSFFCFCFFLFSNAACSFVRIYEVRAWNRLRAGQLRISLLFEMTCFFCWFFLMSVFFFFIDVELGEWTAFVDSSLSHRWCNVSSVQRL